MQRNSAKVRVDRRTKATLKRDRERLRDAVKRQSLTNRNSLTASIAKGIKVVPFLGAGVAVPYGGKSWAVLLEDMATYFEAEDQPKFKNIVRYARTHVSYAKSPIGSGKKSKLDEAASKFKASDSHLYYQFLSERGHSASNISDQDFLQGHKNLCSLVDDIVITTNFDNSVEELIQKSDKHTQKMLVEKSLDVGNLVDPTISVLKLHGEIDTPKTLVFSKDEYEDAYGDVNTKKAKLDLTKRVPLLLQSIALTNVILFVGCSLEDDWTVRVLKALSSKFPKLNLYAIVELPGFSNDNYAEAYRKRNSSLKDAGIKPLWHKYGEYEEIEQHLSKLVQAKEEFIQARSNGAPLAPVSPAKLVSTMIEEGYQYSSLVCLTCSAAHYISYAKKMSTGAGISSLIWSMSGSPLEPQRYISDSDDRTEQDRDFSNLTVAKTKKKRLVIFGSKKEASRYEAISPSRTARIIESKRKYYFERLNRNNLLFTTSDILKKRFDIKVSDFGYASFSSGAIDNSIIFSSNFNNSDFHNAQSVHKSIYAFSAGTSIPKSLDWDPTLRESLRGIKSVIETISRNFEEPDTLKTYGIYENISDLIRAK